MSGPNESSPAPSPAPKPRNAKRGTGVAAATFKIDPAAEPQPNAKATITGVQERNFFDADRAAHELAQGQAVRDHELAKAEAAARQDRESKAQDMGALGAFFGAAWTPAMYIAGFVAVMLALAWLITLACSHADMAEARKSLLAALLSVVSYLFGAAGASARNLAATAKGGK